MSVGTGVDWCIWQLAADWRLCLGPDRGHLIIAVGLSRHDRVIRGEVEARQPAMTPGRPMRRLVAAFLVCCRAGLHDASCWVDGRAFFRTLLAAATRWLSRRAVGQAKVGFVVKVDCWNRVAGDGRVGSSGRVDSRGSSAGVDSQSSIGQQVRGAFEPVPSVLLLASSLSNLLLDLRSTWGPVRRCWEVGLQQSIQHLS